jgi:hypothetical protein
MNMSELQEKIQEIEMRLSAIKNLLLRSGTSNLGMVDSYIPAGLGEQLEYSTASNNRFSNLITKIQGNWLGFLAVICFVFADLFIIKLSIDSGWITTEKRVIASAFFGIALIFARFAFIEFDAEYAAFIQAAGVIIIY